MKRVLKAFLALVVVLAAVFAIYVGDFYHMGQAAAVSASNAVEEGKMLIFQPEEEAEQGLIFYPGGKVEYSAYAPLMEELAEEGILCVITKMPCNLAFFGINAADQVKQRFPEVEEWYLGGHSLGGVAAGLYAQDHSEELEGLILLASYTTSDLSESDLKVLSVYGTEDGVLNRENYAENYANLPKDTTEVILEGGCHGWFGDYGAQKGDGSPTISREEQTEQTAEAIVDWMAEIDFPE